MPVASALSWVLGAVVLAFSWHAAAASASAPQRLRVTYSAPQECPGELTFRTQVQARTTRVEFAADGTELVVQIQKSEAGYSGRLSGSLAGPQPEALAAPTCDEVVAALALLAALRVDSDAGRVAEIEVTPIPPKRHRPRASARVENRTFELVLSVGARSGLGRAWSPALGVGVGWVHRDWARIVQMPDLHLSLMGVMGGTLAKPGLEAELGLVSGALDVCPLGKSFGVRVTLCAAVEGGAVIAQLEPGDSLASPLVAVGSAARMSWSTGPLLLGLRVAGMANLVRPSYFYRPDTVAYATPWWALAGALMAGYSFR
jgi:hypothetical protein